ncbi:MAG: NUDIX hydrolase [Ignavibacteria bacterium]
MKFATLLYITNSSGDYLLLERKNPPNKGLLSPPGGKVNIDEGESPHQCAVREAFEECQILSSPQDWKLLGIITERNYPDVGDILIFCFQYNKHLDKLPPENSEGRFKFYKRSEISMLKIPETDKLFIWDFVLNNKSDFFSLLIEFKDNRFYCAVEQH